MAKQQQSHFVIVAYPAQGHINPAIQFAERLIRLACNGFGHILYYFYNNGFTGVIGNDSDDRPSGSIQLPGLPLLLATCDLPSFLLASNPYAFVHPKFQAQLDELEKESNPRILVNTFDELEPEALKALEKHNLVLVGLLVPYAILDGRDPSDGSKNYIKWLNLKSKSSVIYISFGSLLVLKKQQMEEIAWRLLDFGRPFLWAIRAKENGEEEKNWNKWE
nr:crocetin glucosyltransferase, chloroplastic [Quercus suber]